MENLLQVLKLDSTILCQFLIFFVAYLTLTHLVFKPYLKALELRKEVTIGGKEVAEQLILETQNIQQRYETKAREINKDIKTIFENARKNAAKKHEETLSAARVESEKLLKESQENIQKHVRTTRETLKSQAPELSQSIMNRLLGKDVGV